jgi:S-adenosylmethionine:tRNA-ribosyltransferase-isomerase (queuine synthetase)
MDKKGAIKHAVLDRIESDIAVFESETREMFELPVTALPAGIKPGDRVIFEGNRIIVDKEATEKAKTRIKKLMDDVWKD